ncbi:MAG: aminotransferase class I/II-fold pyridoxal phosphate-dependent enzyme, partial [Spirochaeta sp.]|nr:aminotransferase class I/II-fold pyridoxal phosphate-dependent enzyme [Spirochaeta sp.]
MAKDELLTPRRPGSATGINALERARREYVARNGTDALIDLTNSRFDRAGLAVPETVYAAAWRMWREQPAYAPSGRGVDAARTAVATFLSHRYPGVGADDVIITAGSSVSYHLLFTHLRDAAVASGSGPGAPPLVALPLPGYPLFEDLLRDAGLAPCWYHCLPEQQFLPDPAEIEGLLSGVGGGVAGGGSRGATRGPLVAVVVISPNNPSGVVLSSGTEEAIAAACSRHGAMLIVDEVFAPFVSTDGPHRAPGLP